MERPDYRFFYLLGLILLLAIFGSFFGAYLLFWAWKVYGFLVFVLMIIAIFGLVVAVFLYKSYKRRKTAAFIIPPLTQRQNKLQNRNV